MFQAIEVDVPSHFQRKFMGNTMDEVMNDVADAIAAKDAEFVVYEMVKKATVTAGPVAIKKYGHQHEGSEYDV